VNKLPKTDIQLFSFFSWHSNLPYWAYQHIFEGSIYR